MNKNLCLLCFCWLFPEKEDRIQKEKEEGTYKEKVSENRRQKVGPRANSVCSVQETQEEEGADGSINGR